MRCARNKFSEMSINDRHKVHFSGEEKRHKYGVGFLVHYGHGECCFGVPTSLQQTNLNPPKGSSFSISPSYRFMHQHLDMMTMGSTSSISNSRKL